MSTLTTHTTLQTTTGSTPVTTAIRPAVSSSTSLASSRVTENSTPSLFPPATASPDPPDVDQHANENVFNYYFLILAGFGVILAIGLWWLRQRRRRRKEQMRLNGQNALARDLDGWANTRRWMHGNWRHNQAAGLVRREEGLDERGEAPPPYQPKSEEIPQDPINGLTIPLRTLSRDDVDRLRPPEYQAAQESAVTSNPRLDAARMTVPDAVNVSTSPSGDRLRDQPVHRIAEAS